AEGARGAELVCGMNRHRHPPKARRASPSAPSTIFTAGWAISSSMGVEYHRAEAHATGAKGRHLDLAPRSPIRERQPAAERDAKETQGRSNAAVRSLPAKGRRGIRPRETG
ncbi:MAG TPA: hypothetical protein VGP44_00035, partial [Gemmatimonadales bacterium]|nr:hypothetical protein [Gemmatimonadales bacterium]